MKVIIRCMIGILAWSVIEVGFLLAHSADLTEVKDNQLSVSQIVNILFHWPGIFVAQRLNLSGKGYFIIVKSITFIQMLLVANVVGIIWERLRTKSPLRESDNSSC
jgi:hypothetical protein